MEVMGIKFVPWNTPLKEHLQTLAAGAWFVQIFLGLPTFSLVTFYLLFFTNYWLVTLIYISWIWLCDKDTSSIGGRCIKGARGIAWYRYMRDYFSHTLEKVPNCELDPKKNYLFCAFPHGIFSTGAFMSFATDASGVKELFPHHFTHLLTLRMQFLAPFHREFIYSLGGCDSSATSINYLMKTPGGGKVAVLVVGGAAEAIYARPGETRLVLRNRKGFVKLALKNGCPLVPVFTFGENELFNQLDNSEGTLLRKVQETVKRLTGVTPVTPIGRGLFQRSFGLVPLRNPIHTIVGEPIELEKSENPTQEEIDKVHQKFIKGLEELFENYKHKYIENADGAKLIIV